MNSRMASSPAGMSPSRIMPLSNWTELDIWQYIAEEHVEIPSIYYAHERQVVHRDLKPGNILVAQDGTPKLVDFGISKLLDVESIEAQPPTRTELRAFTPQYASPEQFRGEPAHPASDIYSAGAVLYELVAGVRPHHARSTVPLEIERAVLHDDPEPPSTASRPCCGPSRATILSSTAAGCAAASPTRCPHGGAC